MKNVYCNGIVLKIYLYHKFHKFQWLQEGLNRKSLAYLTNTIDH